MNSEGVVASYTKSKGVALVLTSASLWGISGTVAQYLFQQQGFTPEWLVVIRLLLSGVLLLGFARVKGKQSIWGVWRHKKDWPQLVLFGLAGMLTVQYTYFAAIKHGNAATATLLQYTAPVFIVCYLAARMRRLPVRLEVLAVLLSLIGTFLLVTNGSFRELSISAAAAAWGITSAVALAFYTLQPIQLLNRWESAVIVGWGMLIGGIAFSFIQPPWEMQGEWSPSAVLAVIFVILFGTLTAFYCYMESLKYLSAAETSLLACAEPLTSALLAVVWLHVPFTIANVFGALCIILTIILLSYVKK
ncbi:DMT family transporter [Ectobacillus ponti]|uniref:DMT family transporter n=1 Tax=Ectobacillus ponti TaxID=2961894 RepID=A0AA41XAG4_9BACI|nr:EamA family transporter [Ectobacillus ponti]MCP8969330.1 DMT family transporter [Ectobacillus ponti]